MVGNPAYKGNIEMKRWLALITIFHLMTSVVAADTLYEAVEHGMLSHPDVLQNTALGLAAKHGIDKARGSLLPTVDTNGASGREFSLNPTTQAIDGPGSRTLTRQESSIEMKQTLFAGGANINEVRRAQHLYESQMWKTQSVAEALSLDIVNRYLQVQLHHQLMRLATVNLRAHKNVFRMIKARTEAGIARTADLDQAYARVAQAEANKITAQTDLNEVNINYAKSVGKWPNQLSQPHIPTRQELPLTLGETIEQALDNHPALKSSYADIKEAKSKYKVAAATAYSPKVEFVASGSNNRNLDGLVGPNNDRLAMLRVSYNVFRGGADLASVKQATYQIQESYELKNRQLLDLKETVRLAWNAYIMAGRRLNPLRIHVQSSRKTLLAYQEQFKLDKRTLLDVLDSQNELYRAQIDLARGITDEMYARYRIIGSMGSLLSYLQLRLPVNVVNNDVFSSAQTHILLNRSMDEIPYPDDKNQLTVLSDDEKSVALVGELPATDQVKLTPPIVEKNTTPPIQVTPKKWFIEVGRFQNEILAKSLQFYLSVLGYNATIFPSPSVTKVWVGPYEYRGHAANAMERLKELARIEGRLLTFKIPIVAVRGT